MLLVIVSMYRWVVEGEFDRKNEKKKKKKIKLRGRSYVVGVRQQPVGRNG